MSAVREFQAPPPEPACGCRLAHPACQLGTELWNAWEAAEAHRAALDGRAHVLPGVRKDISEAWHRARAKWDFHVFGLGGPR